MALLFLVKLPSCSYSVKLVLNLVNGVGSHSHAELETRISAQGLIACSTAKRPKVPFSPADLRPRGSRALRPGEKRTPALKVLRDWNRRIIVR